MNFHCSVIKKIGVTEMLLIFETFISEGVQTYSEVVSEWLCSVVCCDSKFDKVQFSKCGVVLGRTQLRFHVYRYILY